MCSSQWAVCPAPPYCYYSCECNNKAIDGVPKLNGKVILDVVVVPVVVPKLVVLVILVGLIPICTSAKCE